MQVNSESKPAPELSPEEFSQEAGLLAMEIVTKVLRPKQPVRTSVVLEALTRLYRYHAMSLPQEAQVACGVALGALAADLLQASVTPESAPAGASVH